MMFHIGKLYTRYSTNGRMSIIGELSKCVSAVVPCTPIVVYVNWTGIRETTIVLFTRIFAVPPVEMEDQRLVSQHMGK